MKTTELSLTVGGGYFSYSWVIRCRFFYIPGGNSGG